MCFSNLGKHPPPFAIPTPHAQRVVKLPGSSNIGTSSTPFHHEAPYLIMTTTPLIERGLNYSHTGHTGPEVRSLHLGELVLPSGEFADT